MGIVKSAGLVIVYKDEILLVHPSGASWTGTYSIPKGEIQDFETPLEAALRETKEEIGIDFSGYPIWSVAGDGIIPYKKKGNGKTYKKVFYFIVRVHERLEIDKENLQKDEVDWAGFIHKDEAKEKIFWRFLPILEKVFALES